ncbi:LOW QUALITY PROTEIN: hypothetical protein OSB04_028356 [Centaurea solstitialis]|uniref:Retrotransposon gag domain-containing protein n=1 Tax=Centaurea solstitialis TaxID=347529 RepID=A0AA38W7M8_9ASTR|nr:LOW QUALITY PROTEIN: hypothetical protein OSB04_028356 [Centaurea solstitialis]
MADQATASVAIKPRPGGNRATAWWQSCHGLMPIKPWFGHRPIGGSVAVFGGDKNPKTLPELLELDLPVMNLTNGLLAGYNSELPNGTRTSSGLWLRSATVRTASLWDRYPFMPRISRGEFFNLDPDIKRTFRRRKKEQINFQTSTSSTMEGDRKLFLEELPFPENQPDERFNDDGLPPPLPPPPGGNGRNQQQGIQPHVIHPHVGPVPIHREPGPQEGNPVNGILRNPPLPNNRQIEDAEQHIFRLANSKDSSMMDYAIPIVHQLQSGILNPTSTVPHFELKTVMFQMLQNNGQFAGLSKEDPHAHLRSFIEIADSFRLRGVSDDALKLKLFPFSLSHHARAWYNSLKPDSITTWNQMAESRNEICTFRQDDDKAVPTAWERFKELLRKCPHHGIPYNIQLETFYNGLNYSARQMLDATAGGAFTASSYNEGYNILEKTSNNNGHWADSRSKPLQLAGTKGDGAYSALAS